MTRHFYQVGMISTAAVILGIGVISTMVGPLVEGITAVVIALGLGMLVGNANPSRVAFDETLSRFLTNRVLKFAVILLGAGINLGGLAEVGATAALIITGAVLAAMGISWWIGRRWGLSDRSALLIGVGTAICGASAIAAVAPILKAKEEEIGLALATVFSFNAVALITYPLIGALLGLPQTTFGTWAGIGVHDTASAVATGFAFGPIAGEIATLVKLGRTLFLIPLIAVAVLLVQREEGKPSANPNPLVRNIPWFIVGFASLAAANTLGWLGAVGQSLNDVGKLLIVFVVVAIGLNLRLSTVTSINRPLFYTGLLSSAAIAVFALVAIAMSPIGFP